MASENAEERVSLDEQLTEMCSFVVEMLMESSQFLSVEPMAEYGRGSALSQESKRNIRAVKHPEYTASRQPEEYLVICNVDAMPAKLFADKLVEASDRGIYIVHICTRSVEEGDGRMFFRKEKLEEERSPGTEKQAKNKEAYEHYTVAERENFRKLRDFEFYLDALTNRSSNYYQHTTERLEEGIRKFRFESIVPHGGWYSEILGEWKPYEIPRMTKLPVETEHLSGRGRITLMPYHTEEHQALTMNHWLEKARCRVPSMAFNVGEFVPADIDAIAYSTMKRYQSLLLNRMDDYEISNKHPELAERIAIMNEGMSERELAVANAVFPQIKLRSLE